MIEQSPPRSAAKLTGIRTRRLSIPFTRQTLVTTGIINASAPSIAERI